MVDIENEDYEFNETFYSKEKIANNSILDILPFSQKIRSKTIKAEEEWLCYYFNLYKSESPDLKLYQKLVKRNGVWDMATPFKDGNPLFYSYCEDGIFLADINFILDKWIEKTFYKSKKDIIKTEFKDSILEKIDKIEKKLLKLYLHRLEKYPSLSVEITEARNSLSDMKKEKRWEEIAIQKMIFLFQTTKDNWVWIKDKIHEDNINILCKILFDSASQKEKKTLLNNWLNNNWLTENNKKWFKLEEEK